MNRDEKLRRLKAYARAHPDQVAKLVPEIVHVAAGLEWIAVGEKRLWSLEYRNGARSRMINGDAGDVARHLFTMWPQGEFFPLPDQAEQVSFRVDGVELALIRVLP